MLNAILKIIIDIPDAKKRTDRAKILQDIQKFIDTVTLIGPSNFAYDVGKYSNGDANKYRQNVYNISQLYPIVEDLFSPYESKRLKEIYDVFMHCNLKGTFKSDYAWYYDYQRKDYIYDRYEFLIWSMFVELKTLFSSNINSIRLFNTYFFRPMFFIKNKYRTHQIKKLERNRKKEEIKKEEIRMKKEIQKNIPGWFE